VIAVVHDVSDSKRAEAAREALLAREHAAREAAEAASHAKDALLATVSHELRTPLSPILLWSNLLRRGDLDQQETAHALDVIARNAGTQARLVEDLLDTSRSMSGTLRLERRPVDVASVLRDAEEVTRPVARAKGVTTEYHLAPECRVEGDPRRLQQVFWNLLSNAVKFTPAGGRVDVSLVREEGQARIRVRDTGVGIPAAFLPRVFERFSQAERPGGSAQQRGLGLGLSIVRQLVEAHGGTVTAESAGENAGAVFTVTLPLAPEAPERLPFPAHPPALPGHNTLAGVRVLVVDDDPDSNEVVQALLTSHGADVRKAGSAQEALALLLDWRPDVILSDLHMPGDDGYALVSRLRQRGDRAAQIPAIALTAFAGPGDHERALAAGFDAHFSKPPHTLELVAAISAAARGGRRAG
jgi:CheY-like chemotaxis protein/nitrogen-specific signal transduction histidine kinase